METNDFMTKKFGASGIKRNMLADYFFGDTVVIEEATDEIMQTLADSLENYMREMYPDADEMFAFWSKDIFTDDDVLEVNAKYSESWKKYWDLFGDFAIASGIKVIPRKK